MRIGIDLGGTKIEGIALDDQGAALVRTRIPAPRGDYDATLDAIVSLVRSIERDAGRHGSVGVGIPGAISPATGLVKNANSTWLNGRPLADDLPRRLGRSVRFANDANCFALSEATDGAAAGASIVFGVIVGTGTGGGVVVDGRVLVGANAIAGEWGHNPLPSPRDEERPGPACYCGRSGCIETFLSGPALAREYWSAGRQPGGTPDAITAEQIAARAAEGEPLANDCLARYEDRMARALAGIINVIDPDVIVLGGGLSNIDRLYANVPKLWGPRVFSDRVTTRLARPVHGDASGVRGAAWLWD
ncbi:MAG: ROK family protein [Betaproteobacteria bacterium]